jgi:hypothetical protein
MVSALALFKLGLPKLHGVLLFFLHKRHVPYTHQSFHKRAIHASKQALIRNITPTHSTVVNKFTKLIYASR